MTLSGVTVAADFKDVSFFFDDNRVVGQYSTCRVQVSMKTSLGTGCFVRVVFPNEFAFDSQLTSFTGSGFLRPQFGSTINMFENNAATRTFAFEACRSTWGQDPSGSVTFAKVKNPDYIRETQSFQI